MKQLISLALTIVLVLTIIPFSTIAEDLTVSFCLQELYVGAILNALRDNLLVPESLSIREIGCIGIECDDSFYYFFVIHYVAQNKLGGYSDDLLFALSTENFGDEQEVAILSGYSSISHGSGKMLSILQDAKLEYLLNEAEIKSSGYWKDLPTESMLY